MRFLACVLEKSALFFWGQVGGFEHRRGRAHDRGQRGADIVRDRAQQVRTHLFLFAFNAQTLLLLDLGGHRAGDEGNAQHGQKGERIAGDREVELPVRVGKNIVDPDDAEQRGKDAEQIAGRKAGDQQHGEHEYRKRKAVAALRHAQDGAQSDRTGEDHGKGQKVPPRDREQTAFVFQMRHRATLLLQCLDGI